MKIGFIGMGIMGSRMAANLLRKGHALVVHNRTRHKADPLISAGAGWASFPSELGQDVQVVITMLSAPDAVEQAALDRERGFLQRLKPGSLWIDCSTVNPSFSRTMAAAAARHKIRFLDAPVAGSKIPAEQGQLLFFVGGEKAAVEEARPLFEAMGKAYIHVGGHGFGSSMKMVNNLMLSQAMAAYAEALVLGESLGIPKDVLFDTLQSSPVSAPFLALKRTKLESGQFDAEFPLKWMHKDMQLVSQTSYEAGAATPAADAAKQIYALADRKGLGDLDFSAIYRFLKEKR